MKVSLKGASPSRGITKAENSRLVEEMKTNLKKGGAANELQSFFGSLNGSEQEVMTAFYEAISDGVEKGFAKEVLKKKRYIAAAVAQGEESQLLLLRAIEGFCGMSSLAAVKEVALVLKALYDADVLEEYIMKWYQDGSTGGNKGSPIWKNATPFVEWLQSAESESE